MGQTIFPFVVYKKAYNNSMLKEKSLFDIIQERIPLGQKSPSGWYSLRCAVCNDHSPRGGFKSDDGYTGYSCFNCGIKFRYEEGSGKLSNDAKNILERFGIPRDALREITSSMFLNKQVEEEITLESLTRPKLFTPEIALPEGSIPLLSEQHEDVQEPLLKYLLARNIDPSRAPFFFSESPRMTRRIIIPYYRDSKVIYWQARHIDAGVKPRYLNCTAAKDAVIYGFDNLYAYDKSPLFITEGVFNAVLLNGSAIMGATLNTAKIELLKRSRRRLIFVRDRDLNGDKLSEQVLDNGWEITTVDNRVNDVNDSVNRFGLAYTAYSLIKNAQHPENKLKSSISLNLWGLEDRLRNRK